MPDTTADVMHPVATPDAPRLLHVVELGVVPYDDVLHMQREAARARIVGELTQDLLIVVQHPPVITLGRSTKPGHLLASRESLEARGIQVREVERGGDITVHEPGQLVLYPIIDLKRHRCDLHWYLRQLEELVIRALHSFGIDAGREPGRTGVWREGRKLASIGVHARDWVTWHGVALNVCNDLATFAHVVPCGIDRVTMTTVARESATLANDARAMDAVASAMVSATADIFRLERLQAPATVLERIVAHASPA